MHAGHPNRPVVALLAALLGLAAYNTLANRPAPPLEPAVVAVVDLERVFQSMDERGAADAALRRMAEALDATGQERRDGIELLRQDLDLYAPGSKQYEETAQTIARQTFELQAYLDFAMRKLDAEKARTLRGIYDRIKSVAEETARDGGYDLVVVDDSIVDLPAELNEGETMRQISARRLLYTNPSIDITDALIERMNERFGQGG